MNCPALLIIIASVRLRHLRKQFMAKSSSSAVNGCRGAVLVLRVPGIASGGSRDESNPRNTVCASGSPVLAKRCIIAGIPGDEFVFVVVGLLICSKNIQSH